jgi:ABC-type uncharacterized transport system auxiliary subunit
LIQAFPPFSCRSLKWKKLNVNLNILCSYFRCAAFASALALAGCGGLPLSGPASAPLTLDVAAKIEPGQVIQTQRPFVLRITKYVDARPGAVSGFIGNVNSTIFDMHTSKLEVQDLPGIVTAAIQNQFNASGFESFIDGSAAAPRADFNLAGVIRKFRMDIAARDDVSIEVESTLTDARDGAVLWSGVVAEKTDRFAGVAGNTRNTITRYLSAALGKVSTKTRETVSSSIAKTYPDLFIQATPAHAATAGVNVMTEPVPRVTAPKTARLGATGYLQITTIPPRAKVYIADVYYGLSPLKLELDPGIFTLQLKLEPFKTATEKISVRKDDTTEIEIRFEK